MTIVFWTMLGYICGALPFSVWLGRLALREDVRRYGDGNPGAANAWKAGGWPLGFSVLLLDFLKGAVPVALAHFTVGIAGLGLVPVGLAPILGHAFSPFLGFRGGKAITVTFGVWTGLLPPAGPIVLGALQTALHFARLPRAWTPIIALCGLLIYLLIFAREPAYLLIWLGNTAIVAWKFRRDLLPGHTGSQAASAR